MKKILTLLAIGIVGLTSCKKNDEQQNFYLMQLWDYSYNDWQGDAIKAFGDSEKSIYIQAMVSGNNPYYSLPQEAWNVTCDKDWCHFEYRVSEPSVLSLTFTCDENTTGNDRKAVLTVNAGEQSLQIYVGQLGTPSVTISTPGTLTQELANKDLLYATSLKISGELNDKDLETIKGLREAEALDLTDAIIDDLPDEMFYQNETIKRIKLPETIKTIHSKTFAFSSLEYIYFPSNIEVIEDGGTNYNDSYNWFHYGAFANTNLATIEFAPGSKLRYIGDYAFVAAGGTFGVIFPASVEEIGSGVFSYNSKGEGENYESKEAYIRIAFEKDSELTSIGFISNDNSMSIDASNCAKVKSFGWLDGSGITVYIGTQTPPQFGGISVNSWSPNNTYLYVPKGCVGAYYEADGWKDFDVIKEIEQE